MALGGEMEKKFYVESATSSIQDIGLRAQIVSFLIASGISRGNAVNDNENQHKVIVVIATNETKDNEIKNIENIRDALVMHLNSLNKKGATDFCYSKFPTDITASSLMELTNPHPVVVLDLTTLSNSLMLEQTSKGAGAMIRLAESMGNLAESMGSLAGSMGSLAGSMGRLPKDIARELAELLKGR